MGTFHGQEGGAEMTEKLAEMAAGFRLRVTGLEQIPAGKLVPDTGNPRIHTDHQKTVLSAILEEVGFAGALLVRPLGRGRFAIIDGHERHERFSDDDLVPCLVTDLNETEARKILATYDQIGSMAGWDAEKLEALAAEVNFENPDLNQLVDDCLADVLASLEESGGGGGGGPDDVPEVSRIAKTKPGDVFALGRHRLICGDALDPDVVGRVMDDRRVSIVISDPPYNVQYTGGTKDKLTIENDEMSELEYADFLEAAFRAVGDHLGTGVPFYLFHAYMQRAAVLTALDRVDWEPCQTLVWIKNMFALGYYDYHWQQEPCFYGYTPGRRRKWRGPAGETTVLDYDKPSRSEQHPTMKPVEMLERLLRNSSAKDSVVYDPFGGSGSTLIAAEQTGRSAVLVEIDPVFCDVIVDRWEAFTGATSETIT
jgi:site-specific DNA-methyltransferase (adenine-specific)